MEGSKTTATAHTPGPWRFESGCFKLGETPRSAAITTQGGQLVALIPASKHQAADAALFFAAPALLEALHEVLPHAAVIINKNHPAMRKACAAIAAAAGEA